MTHCPEDGGSKHLWNCGKLLPDYTALQPRRQKSTIKINLEFGENVAVFIWLKTGSTCEHGKELYGSIKGRESWATFRFPWSENNSVSWSLLSKDWATGVQSLAGHRIFLIVSASRPALWPTQPPIRWVPVVPSLGGKRGRGVTLTSHLHLVPRSRTSRSYTSSTCQAPPWRVAGQLYFYFTSFPRKALFHGASTEGKWASLILLDRLL
jgi:hypothetical protein